MSTLTIDDALYQRATEAAAAQGKTVDEFVGEALRKALSMVGVWHTIRNGLPVMIVSHDTPPIDPAKVRQCLEEEGFDCAARYQRVARPGVEQPCVSRHDASAGWATCLLTQTGSLRLSLNPRAVGVSIDCQAAVHLLPSLVTHPHHQHAAIAPALTTTPCDELVPKIIAYRQASDTTPLYLARVGGLRLVTCDRPVAAVCPWPEHLELLIP
jgi:hypothetical protein